MATTPVNNSFYADPKAISALRQDAKSNSTQGLRETARQFESLFTAMVLKSMRAATPKDPLFGSDQQDFYQDMFDQQLATQLSKGKGLGLADMLVGQLMRSGAVPAGSGTAPASATPAAPASGVASQGAAATWPPTSKAAFVEALLPAATAVGQKLGVDPQSLIAHAALETGWGRSIPRAADGSCSFNLFGIKATGGWTGPQTSAPTSEVINGQVQRQSAAFRSYASPEACLEDYGRLLSANPRYAGALGTGPDTAAFAGALQQAGYATDPHYANKLTAVAAELKSRVNAPITVSDFT